MEPFQLTFTLTRRQRLRVELPPWLPAVAATLGFGLGAAYVGLYASPWLLCLLLLPLIVYRGLFVFAFDLIANSGHAVEVRVGEAEMEIAASGESKNLPLDGIFQVFRSGDTWTVLHLNGTVLTIPASAITGKQIGYLRAFAHRAAAARTAAQS